MMVTTLLYICHRIDSLQIYDDYHYVARCMHTYCQGMHGGSAFPLLATGQIGWATVWLVPRPKPLTKYRWFAHMRLTE